MVAGSINAKNHNRVDASPNLQPEAHCPLALRIIPGRPQVHESPLCEEGECRRVVMLGGDAFQSPNAPGNGLLLDMVHQAARNSLPAELDPSDYAMDLALGHI